MLVFSHRDVCGECYGNHWAKTEKHFPASLGHGVVEDWKTHSITQLRRSLSNLVSIPF